MKLLLDSHAFIWWDEEPSRLSAAARSACLNFENSLVLSVASVWEMQLKLMLGKLRLRKPLRELIDDQIRENGLEMLPVNLEHVLALESLPPHHKDPFDRLLVSQAITEKWHLVSHDPEVAKYPVKRIW
jgi:PIN domain nuclease of toxin-antitoxin system